MAVPDRADHFIDARLLALLGLVSNHFGSRRIDIISGFRPYSPTQYTAHSNHNVGHAVDFRIEGVPNEVVRDFCRTLHDVGVGYYPNSVFVHLDSRATSAYWVDFSHPGEAPKYDAPNPAIDEGASDVAGEVHVAQPSEPSAVVAAPTLSAVAAPTRPAPTGQTPPVPAHGSSATPAR